jgi:hypothetical protein
MKSGGKRNTSGAAQVAERDPTALAGCSARANDLSNSNEFHAADELRAPQCNFEFGKLKPAATLLVMTDACACPHQKQNMTDFEVWHIWRMERIGKMDKNDRKYGQFASVSHLINVAMENNGEWVQSLFDNGFRMYLVTFNHIPASSEYKRREMLKQVEYQFIRRLLNMLNDGL